MKHFTKDTFAYLFQIGAIFILFSNSPVSSGTKAKKDSYPKNLVLKKPYPDLKIITTSVKKEIEPAVFNKRFKTKLLPGSTYKISEKNFTHDNTNKYIAEPISISFPQIVLK